MGRPRIEITDELLAKVKKLAAQGLTQEQMARALGFSVTTIKEKKRIYSSFKTAIKDGQAMGIAKVTNALFEKAITGDNVAMIYYLKNRDNDNWNERSEADQARVKQSVADKQLSQFERLIKLRESGLFSEATLREMAKLINE